MKITVDVNTDSTGFGYVEAGQYKLRVKSCDQAQGPNFPYLKWAFDFVDANVIATDGKSKVGCVFENTTLKSGDNAQFALKRVCDALGLVWGDFDTDQTIGVEFDAMLKVAPNNNGEMRNEVAKYLPVA